MTLNMSHFQQLKNIMDKKITDQLLHWSVIIYTIHLPSIFSILSIASLNILLTGYPLLAGMISYKYDFKSTIDTPQTIYAVIHTSTQSSTILLYFLLLDDLVISVPTIAPTIPAPITLTNSIIISPSALYIQGLLLIVIIYTEILYKYGGSLRKITMLLIIYIIFKYIAY